MNGCVKVRLPKRDFGKWVRDERESQSLSLSDLASRAGDAISKPYIQFIETRRVMPLNITLKKLIALARGLNVPPGEVIKVAFPRAGNTRKKVRKKAA